MTYRTTTFVSIIAVLSLFTFTSCDILDTGEDHVNEVRLNFQTSESTVEAGGNTVEIKSIKLLIDEFAFVSPHYDQERDTLIVDSLMYPKKFPKIVSFGSEGKLVELGELELGNYFTAALTIRPPAGDLNDSDLGSDYSFVVKGDYNGSAFTMKLNTNQGKFENIFPQSLLMNDQTATVNLDFTVRTETMFQRKPSKLYDPTKQATADTLSKYLFKYITLREGARTLRKYENMR